MTGVGTIREAWVLLEQMQARDLRVRRLDRPTDASKQTALAVGLDALGRRHLLVPVRSEQLVVEDRRSSGVQITRHVLVDGDETRTFVDVICAKVHLNELFDVIVDEMIVEVSAAPQAPDLACRRVLERWRELIEQESATGAGPERMAGLFAELWHLRELARISPARALDKWVGPQGGRHDFMGLAASLEVKASLGRSGRFAEIHSVEQLERPIGAALYLAMMKLERAVAAGQNVGQLAEEIGNLGIDRRTLLARMREAGFGPADLSVDHPSRFTVVESRVYRVDEDFPAITAASFVGGQVPPGVLRLRYLIDLSTDSPAPLPDDDVPAMYQLLAEE